MLLRLLQSHLSLCSFVNDPNLLHFSYGRYLENQLRESFDFDGTGIEIEYRARKE